MVTQIPHSFAELLRFYRERSGLTQAELAEQAGLTAKAIGALERGVRSQPYLHTVHALASALALSSHERDQLLAARRPRTTELEAEPASVPQVPPPPRISHLLASLPELIGRASERNELLRLLRASGCRLVTLVGPGGIGKTSLALQIAADFASSEEPAFAGGVAVAPLAAAAAATEVPLAIVSALGDPIQGAGAVTDQLIAALRERELLLVLDNLEQFLGPQDGAILAALVTRIIAEAPGVRDECVLELSGLALPTIESGPRAERAEAVQLFLERARRVAPSFVLSAKNRDAVVHICRRLEGMPLAIELAAAWARTLSASEIAAEVDRALDFLTLADRDALPRHRSMRAALDHSWSLLGEAEQQALARCSVFSGGFDREAFVAIGRGGVQLGLLTALIDKSLVRREEVGGGTRYTLHELVRQYAAERLAEHPEEQSTTEQCHTAYYAALLQRAIDVHTGVSTPPMRAMLDREIDNLRAAWARAAATKDSAALSAMARGMRILYDSHGWLQDAAELFRLAAEALRGMSGPATAVRGLVLGLQGFFLVRTGHLAAARPLLEQGQALLQQAGSEEGLSELLYAFGIIGIRLSQYGQAREHFSQVVLLAQSADNEYQRRWAAFYVGWIAQFSGDYATAEAAYQSYLDSWQGQSYPRGESIGRSSLGEIARRTGQLDRAGVLLRESLRIAGAAREKLAMGLALTGLGKLALDRHVWEEATYLLAEAAGIMREIQDTWLLGLALCALGQATLARGELRAALRIYTEVLELVRQGETGLTLELGVALAELLDRDGRAQEALALLTAMGRISGDYETHQRRAALERRLAPAQRAASAELAGTRPLVQWLEELSALINVRPDALAQPTPTAASASASPAPKGSPSPGELAEPLSPREIEVLRLLVAGAGNQQIADTLVISLYTAKHHVASILQKLGVATRTQAALRGRELLVDPAA
jgi:predicted ATPase/DNA-binding CsgD family transcriptional regulator/DNA-binding XRE family transcriptional regulator